MMRLRFFAMLLLLSVCLGTTAASPAFSQAASLNNNPVTFTQLGWRNQGCNLIYSGWRYAFANFSFYGFVRPNWLYAGGRLTLAIEGSKSGLTNLIQWLPQTGPPRSLNATQDFVIPAPLPNVGALAGEVVALTMNIAFNDMRLMPRHPGYDLEKFTIKIGPMKGRTVGYALDIGDRVLGGDPPVRYGIPNHQVLSDVLRAINANYEFIGYGVYINRGYLAPNRPLGRPAPPHYPRVP